MKIVVSASLPLRPNTVECVKHYRSLHKRMAAPLRV
jgi:hypothetical protein